MNQPANRPNPFVGPRPFQEHEVLYGRERETGQLFNLILAERIVLMYSPSGAGKTSLLRASLVPRLKARRFTVLPVLRVNLLPSTKTPAANRYIHSLLTDLEEARPEAERLSESELAGMRLADYLSRYTDQRSVLIFDQFEEILTLDPTDTRAKQEFFDQVSEALQMPSRFAIFAMREDYLAGLEPYLRPLPNRLKATFRLDLLGKAAAQEVLERTAHDGGVDFDPAAAARLVDDLSRVQVQQPDGNIRPVAGAYVEPVQLQVVGNNLWQKLAPDQSSIALERLDEIGNVDRSLAEYYASRVQAVAQETGVGERWIRRWFERKLITESGIRGQVLMEPSSSGDLPNEAIALLENAHLVRRDTRRGTTWFELTHDRLLNPIQQDNTAWFNTHLSLLQRQAELWRDEGGRDELLLREQALLDAEAWADVHATELTELEGDFLRRCRAVRHAQQERLDHERKQKRRLQIFAGVALTAAVLAIVLSFVALAARSQAAQKAQEALAAEATAVASRDDAEAQRKEAETQRKEADTQRSVAETQRLQAEKSATLAEQERRKAEREQGIARAGELAAEARAVFPAYPQRSLLLAVEAASSARLFDNRHPATLQSLVQVLSTNGGSGEGNTYQEIYGMNLAPGGRWLVVDYESVQRFYDLSSGTPVALPWAPPEPIGSADRLFFSPSGRWLLDSSTLQLYDLEAENPLDTPALDLAVQRSATPDASRTVLFTGEPGGSEWLAVLLPGSVLLVDLSSEELSIRMIKHPIPGEFLGLRASPPGEDGSSRWLQVQSFTNCAAGDYLVDLESATGPTASPVPDDNCLGIVDFSSDGNLLYGLSQQDNSLRYWDLTASGYPSATTGLAGLRFFPAYSDDFSRMAYQQDSSSAGPFSQSRVSGGLRTAFQEQNGQWLAWDLSGKEIDPLESVPILPLDQAAQAAFPFAADTIVSPDGRWLLQADDRQALLYKLRNPAAGSWFPLEEYAYIQVPRRFSPDGRWLMTGCYVAETCLYDLSQEDPAANPLVLGGHESWIGLYAFSQDGSRLATASADTTIRVWDLTQQGFSISPLRLGTIRETYTYPILAASPDSRWVFYDQTLWDLAPLSRGEEPQAYDLPGVDTLVAVFSPDNRWLAIASNIGATWNRPGTSSSDLYLWDLRAQSEFLQKQPQVLEPVFGQIGGLAFSPDSRWLVESSGNLWSLAQPIISSGQQPVRSLPGSSFQFTSDSQGILIVSPEGISRLALESDAQGELVDFAGITGQSVAISPDGRWVVTISEQSYMLWEIDGTQVIQAAWSWPVGWNSLVQFSPDSRYLALGSDDSLRIFTLTTASGSILPMATPANASAAQLSSLSMLFSARGKWLLNNNSNLNMTSLFGPLALPLASNQAMVSSAGSGLAFIPIGMGGGGGGGGGGIGLDVQTFKSAYLWPVDDLMQDPATQPFALGGHPDTVQTFLISQDESWAVTLSNNRQLRLWNLKPAEQGQALQAILLPESEFPIEAIGFLPDSKWLVTTDSQGGVNLWPLELNRLETAACRVAGRNLTLTEWQRYFPNAPYRKTCPDLPLHASVVTAAAQDINQLVSQGQVAAAIQRYRELLQESPGLPADNLDWQFLCNMAVRKDQYDLVRVECQSAGLQEDSLRAINALFDAKELIKNGEITPALQFIQAAQELDPTQTAPYAELCGQAANLGQFDAVKDACLAAGYDARQSLWSYQLSRIETLLHQDFEFNQAAIQLGDYLAADSGFEAYAAQSADLIGELCQAAYYTGGDYYRIEGLCESAYYNSVPFPLYILIREVRDAVNYDTPDIAAQALRRAYEKYQELGSNVSPENDSTLASLCDIAANLELVAEYGPICDQAGINMKSRVQENKSLRLSRELNSLLRYGEIQAANDLISQNRSEAPFFSQDQIQEFCSAANLAGQYELAKIACESYGINQADLDPQVMLGRMTDLLNSGRIDDALLLFNRILDTTPANRLPDSAWGNLCSYGVEAGQFYKVRGACARVQRPAG